MINRIFALLIRYKNISFGSFPRLLSIFYWPTVQVLFWGYFTNFFMSNESFGIWSALNIILSAVVLWDVLFRGQLGLTMSFFEELWSRNLPNLKKKPTMKRASSKVKPYNNYNHSNNNEIHIEQFSENMKETENYNNENSEKIKRKNQENW